MKVTTEKLPKSLLALTVELGREQVEKGLDRAARRLSQKYNIPGFRKGKAPRFIVENYFGRPALLEEASEDLVNKAFKAALDQENIEPIGQANLEAVSFESEPYQFRVLVPVSPTVTLPDYRAIRAPFEITEITNEIVDQAMKSRRERHAVLKEPEEPRPVSDGDQLTVELEAFVDGEPLEPREPGAPVPESTLVMEAERLAPGLYEGLLGVEASQMAQITSQIPDDHTDERVRGKEVQFSIVVKKIQSRLLPDWEELPVLDEFDGSLDELREKTRIELIETASTNAERKTTDEFIKQLVEQTTFDIPDVLIEREADRLVHQEEQEFERYGVTAEQIYQMRGQKREDRIAQVLPQGEERLKMTLALSEVVNAEGLTIADEEIDAEVDQTVNLYKEEERDRIRNLLSNELRMSIANSVLDKKLRKRMVAIATGETPAAEPAAESAPVEAAPADPAAAEAEQQTA